MKTQILKVILIAIFVKMFNFSYTQPLLVTEVPLPIEYSGFYNCIPSDVVMFGNQIIFGEKNSGVFSYYDGTNWEVDFNYAELGSLSGMLDQNGDIVCYTNSDDGFYKWNNLQHRWNLIPRPSNIVYGSDICVKDAQNVWFISNLQYPFNDRLVYYNGITCTEIAFFNNMSTELHGVNDIGDIFFHVSYTDFNKKFFRFSSSSHTTDTLFTLPVSTRDIKTIDYENFFLINNDFIFHYNINTNILDTIVQCNGFTNTLALVSNSMMFVGGYDGIKQVFIQNDGSVSSRIVYTTPYHWGQNNEWGGINSSYVDGDKAIFIGEIVNNDTYNYVMIQFPTTKVNENEEYIFNINPNPFSDILNISSVYTIDKIQIFDISGKLIFSDDINSNNTSINVSTLNSGMYILKIYSNNKFITKKIIKT